MIYTFRFISDEEDSFILDVNINHDQTFEELHNKIQETLDYDPSQMASFFSSNDEWEKLQEVAQMPMGDDTDVMMMSETTIGELFSERHQRILYIFDYFAERLFFGSLTRTIDAPSPITLPSVSRIEGKVPEQIAPSNILDEEVLAVDDDYDTENYGLTDDGNESLDDYLANEDLGY
jgi:hypothetical protein